jgi:hypothetical protein
MRNLLMAGTAAGLMLFGTIGAANASNPNVPSWSPYALMSVSPAPAHNNYSDSQGGYGYDQGSGDGVIEGRSAYIDPDYAYDEGPDFIDPGYDDFGYGGFGYGGYGGSFGRGGHFGGGHLGGGHFGGGHSGGGRMR